MEKAIKKFIQEFLVHLGIDFADLEVGMENPEKIRINILSDEPNLLIGHHGENLLAMQKLIKVYVHKNYGGEIDVFFDVDNYRRRQEENVISVTKQKVEEVRSTGVQATLPPMSAYFRRVAHLFIRDNNFTDMETESIGEGNYRQVLIKPKK